MNTKQSQTDEKVGSTTGTSPPDESRPELRLTGRFIEPDVPQELRFQACQFDPNMRRNVVNKGNRLSPDAMALMTGDKSLSWEFRLRYKKLKEIL